MEISETYMINNSKFSNCYKTKEDLLDNRKKLILENKLDTMITCYIFKSILNTFKIFSNSNNRLDSVNNYNKNHHCIDH